MAVMREGARSLWCEWGRDSLEDTKRLADDIVETLRRELPGVRLPAFRCVYIAGSYVRGDWLQCSSDLDIHTIYDDAFLYRKDEDLAVLQEIVRSAIAGREFPSHCPGGIEYGFSHSAHVPISTQAAVIPSPYAYFSTLLFDLQEHHINLYGEALEDILPAAPDPKASAQAWARMLLARLADMEEGDARLSFITYKLILALQLVFGISVISKYRILGLYQRYVPYFREKSFGEMVIRNYIGSFYPSRPPLLLSLAECKGFARAAERLLSEWNPME